MRHWFEQRQFDSEVMIDARRWEVAQKKRTALLMVFVDIEPEQDADFNAWYNEEHVPDLLKLYRAPWSI